MFKSIRAAMKYGKVLTKAIDLIEEIHISMKDDGSISKQERSKLQKGFWKLVKAIQDPVKAS